MTQLIFWTAAIGVVYSYLIYPIVLLLLRAFHRPSKEIPTERTPKVTLIITAYNESSNISEKLDNSVESTYPMDELQIIVASDASDDGTDSIVLNRPEKNIELIRSPDRRGKEHAQGLAVRAAKGEILVFSDAGTRLDSDAIMQMVRQFDNPTVGAVSSEDKFISETGQIVGEGAYVRYEMALRRLESEVNSIVGLSGSFFAARRDVCENWREDIPSDFNIAMNAVRLGYRAVSAKNIHGYYRDIKDSGKEFSRKVRTVIRGLTAFFARIEMLNPIRYPVFSYQLLSHKLCRWLVPWALVVCFIANLFLLSAHSFYQATLIAQLAVYACAIIGHVAPRSRTYAPVSICYFFILVNIAIAIASVQFLLGKRMIVWQPSQR